MYNPCDGALQTRRPRPRDQPRARRSRAVLERAYSCRVITKIALLRARSPSRRSCGPRSAILTLYSRRVAAVARDRESWIIRVYVNGAGRDRLDDWALERIALLLGLAGPRRRRQRRAIGRHFGGALFGRRGTTSAPRLSIDLVRSVCERPGGVLRTRTGSKNSSARKTRLLPLIQTSFRPVVTPRFN